MYYLELLIVLLRGIGWLFFLLAFCFGFYALIHGNLNDYTLLIWPVSGWATFFVAGLLKSLV